MADLARWSPFEEIARIQGFAFGPAIDVRETDTHLIVEADVPGVDPENIDLVVTENGLTVRGEVKEEKKAQDQGFHRIERRYGSFQRTIPFPAPVRHEEAVADYKNGVLEVRVPKKEPDEKKATRLKIRNRDVQ